MKKTGKNLRRLQLIIGGLLMLVLIVGVVFMIRGFLADSDHPKVRQVQQISLIKPPPPPPPEKPPEPVPPKEQVKMDEPPPDQPKQDAPPPSANLGLDADGKGDGDGFGLVGNKGGRDITIGGNGSRFKGYLGSLQDSLRDEMEHSDKLRKAQYKAVIAIWIGKGGSIDHYEISGSSGSPDIDAEVKRVLATLKPFEEPPPDMPQPVKLRISSR